MVIYRELSESGDKRGKLVMNWSWIGHGLVMDWSRIGVHFLRLQM